MLRFKEDVRTLATLAVCSLSVGAAWHFNPSGWLALPVIVWLCALSWLCAVIAHNVVHGPVFKQRWLNRWLQVWVSLCYGFPISDYVPGHNLSHHRYLQKAEDVMRTSRVNFRWNLLNLIFFMAAVTPGIVRGNGLYLKQVGRTASLWRRQLLLESIFVWGFKIAVLVVDWQRGLLFVWLPHLFANWGIVSVNLLQHDGCDENDKVNHSRNFVGTLFNFFTLNNGYHGAHHDVPGLHWSLLPKYHAEHLAPTIHPALEQKSLFVYLVKTYVWPAKRLTYDGKPLVVTPLASKDWVQTDDTVPPDTMVAA